MVSVQVLQGPAVLHKGLEELYWAVVWKASQGKLTYAYDSQDQWPVGRLLLVQQHKPRQEAGEITAQQFCAARVQG